MATSPYRWVDRHLKFVGVVLPVTFVVVLEAVRFVVDGSRSAGESPWGGYRPILVVVTVLAIVTFSLGMFRLIERAQSALRRQNRELAATNDLSSSIQGEAGVERIIDAALDIVLSASGATYGAVTVFPPEGSGEDQRTRTRMAGRSPVTDQAAFGDAPTVELPLSTGSATVGRMDLWLPRESGAGFGLSSGTLHTIGSQLASAIQLGQLVGDLHRRKNEGHAFYDILLQISHHTPPVEILGAVVQHARELLQSDGVVITLTDEAARAVEFAGGTPEAVEVGSQTRRVTTGMEEVAETGAEGAAGGFDVSGWSAEATATVRGPIGDLGRLWVGRRGGEGYTDRDRGFLSTLSGFAAIAITSAQLRENGRQRAVLAERERIAREMHDSLAQVLGSTHLRLRVLEARPGRRERPAGPRRGLRPRRHLPGGLPRRPRGDPRAARLQQDRARARGTSSQTYLAKYSQQSQIATRLENDLDRPPGALAALRGPDHPGHPGGPDQRAQARRRHEVVVRILEDGPMTTFVVEDDGHGFDAARPGRRRLRAVHHARPARAARTATSTIQSTPGAGTRVIARVPERAAPRPAR